MQSYGKTCTYLVFSFYRSSNVREIAFVNVCWFSSDNQSPRCLPYFSGRHVGGVKGSTNMARLHTGLCKIAQNISTNI